MVGLPLHLWDEGNFRAITRKMGVISNSIEINMARIDVSHMKICVITTSLKRISEEITVFANYRIFKVGIYEIYDDWKPFSTQNYDNDSEFEDEDDEDAISDTMIVEEENKSDKIRETLGEGEIDSEFELERVAKSQFEENVHEAIEVEFPVADPADIPDGVGVKAIINDERPENLNGELGRSKEDQ